MSKSPSINATNNIFEALYTALFHDVEKVFRIRKYGGVVPTKDKPSLGVGTEESKFINEMGKNAHQVLNSVYGGPGGRIDTNDVHKALSSNPNLLRIVFYRTNLNPEIGELKPIYDGSAAGSTRGGQIHIYHNNNPSSGRYAQLEILSLYSLINGTKDLDPRKLVHIYYTLKKYGNNKRLLSAEVELVGNPTVAYNNIYVKGSQEYEDLLKYNPNVRANKDVYPLGPFVELYTYLYVSDALRAKDNDLISLKPVRSYGSIFKAEDVSEPFTPLSIHTTLGAAIQAASMYYSIDASNAFKNSKVALYHVVFSGYKDLISRLPYTFHQAESMYLRFTRAINLILYGLLRALSLAIRLNYLNAANVSDPEFEYVHDYVALIRSPADMFIPMFVSNSRGTYVDEKEVKKVVDTTLIDLSKRLEEVQIELEAAGERRRTSLSVVPKYISLVGNVEITNAASFRIKTRGKSNFVERNLGGFSYTMVNPTEYDEMLLRARVRIPTVINAGAIKSSTEFFVLKLYRDKSDVYPAIYAYEKGKVSQITKKFDDGKDISEVEKYELVDIVVILYAPEAEGPEGIDYLGIFEKRLEAADKLRNDVQRMTKNVELKKKKEAVGIVDLFVIPSYRPVDLEQKYKRDDKEPYVLHRRFAFPEPAYGVMRLKKFDKIYVSGIPKDFFKNVSPVHYLAFLEEALMYRGLTILPSTLAPLNPTIIYVARDESYYLTDTAGDFSRVISLLKSRDEARYPVEVILEATSVKKPIYYVKANTDGFIELRPVRAGNDYLIPPRAVAFSMPIGLKELAEALTRGRKILEESNKGKVNLGAIIRYLKPYSKRFILDFFERIKEETKKEPENRNYTEAIKGEEKFDEFLNESLYILTRLDNLSNVGIDSQKLYEIVGKPLINFAYALTSKDGDDLAFLNILKDLSGEKGKRKIEIMLDIIASFLLEIEKYEGGSIKLDVLKYLKSATLIARDTKNFDEALNYAIKRIEPYYKRDYKGLKRELMRLQRILLLTLAIKMMEEHDKNFAPDPNGDKDFVKRFLTLAIASRLADVSRS